MLLGVVKGIAGQVHLACKIIKAGQPSGSVDGICRFRQVIREIGKKTRCFLLGTGSRSNSPGVFISRARCSAPSSFAFASQPSGSKPSSCSNRSFSLPIPPLYHKSLLS